MKKIAQDLKLLPPNCESNDKAKSEKEILNTLQQKL